MINNTELSSKIFLFLKKESKHLLKDEGIYVDDKFITKKPKSLSLRITQKSLEILNDNIDNENFTDIIIGYFISKIKYIFPNDLTIYSVITSIEILPGVYGDNGTFVFYYGEFEPCMLF